MLKLGKIKIVELDDDETMEIAKRLMKKPMFRQQFIRIDRSDKYMIFRVALHSKHYNEDGSNLQPFTYVEDRKRYMPGDLRVCWYEAVCPQPVHFLAQQVEPAPGVF